MLGRKEVPGRPHLYGTGKQFLIDFGLSSLSDLPEIAQLMDQEELESADQESVDQQTSNETEQLGLDADQVQDETDEYAGDADAAGEVEDDQTDGQ